MSNYVTQIAMVVITYNWWRRLSLTWSTYVSKFSIFTFERYWLLYATWRVNMRLCANRNELYQRCFWGKGLVISITNMGVTADEFRAWISRYTRNNVVILFTYDYNWSWWLSFIRPTYVGRCFIVIYGRYWVLFAVFSVNVSCVLIADNVCVGGNDLTNPEQMSSLSGKRLNAPHKGIYTHAWYKTSVIYN